MVQKAAVKREVRHRAGAGSQKERGDLVSRCNGKSVGTSASASASKVNRNPGQGLNWGMVARVTVV